MSRQLMLFALCVLALLMCRQSQAQVEITGAVGEPSRSFVLDALSFAADTAHSRLDIFIQVGYDNLTFMKDGDNYSASYELTTTLYDSTNGVIDENTTNGTDHRRHIRSIGCGRGIQSNTEGLYGRSGALLDRRAAQGQRKQERTQAAAPGQSYWTSPAVLWH